MTIESSRGRQSARVRGAQHALLNATASSLLQPVREVLCEPTRTQIVRALGGGPLCVSDLAAVLARSKSATSQHLRILRDGGIVGSRRRGRTVYYSLQSSPMVDATVHILDTAAAAAVA